MVLNTILIAIVSLVVLFYAYIKKSYSYWSSRDVLEATPSFPFGNLQGISTKYHPADITRKIYNKFVGQGQFVGAYFFLSPVVIALDPEMVKNIMVRDFNYFHDRGFYHNEKDDPLSGHLFSLAGNRWKNLRSKLSPTFTSGKMKMMFGTVASIADQMADHMKSVANTGDKVDIKDFVSRYSTDVIGTCAFGIECNSLKDPDTDFRKYGRRVFEPPKIQQIRVLLQSAYPKLSRFFGLWINDVPAAEFFYKTTKSVVEYRREKNVERNDFLQMLMQLGDKDGSDNEKLTMNEIAAQAFLFFLAGFETSGTTMQFCLYEMALNQEVQDRAREEIQQVLENNGGKITYESMLQLPYLDMCINESLRMYPAVDNLFRVTDKDYKVPGTKTIIEKGTRIVIPVYGMQRDPKIYPNPKVFDPERFNEENTKARHPFSFMPFGEGPRICIGMRFGMMQTRLGLISILMKYRVKPCDDTPREIIVSPTCALLAPDKTIQLHVESL